MGSKNNLPQFATLIFDSKPSHIFIVLMDSDAGSADDQRFLFAEICDGIMSGTDFNHAYTQNEFEVSVKFYEEDETWTLTFINMRSRHYASTGAGRRFRVDPLSRVT